MSKSFRVLILTLISLLALSFIFPAFSDLPVTAETESTTGLSEISPENSAGDQSDPETSAPSTVPTTEQEQTDPVTGTDDYSEPAVSSEPASAITTVTPATEVTTTLTATVTTTVTTTAATTTTRHIIKDDPVSEGPPKLSPKVGSESETASETTEDIPQTENVTTAASASTGDAVTTRTETNEQTTALSSDNNTPAGAISISSSRIITAGTIIGIVAALAIVFALILGRAKK